MHNADQGVIRKRVGFRVWVGREDGEKMGMCLHGFHSIIALHAN
jgi:hypothetical protein